MFYATIKGNRERFIPLARELGGCANGSGVIGTYNGIQYIIHFAEGHSGGSAGGATRVGYPSSLRIVVEKTSDVRFLLSASKNTTVPFAGKEKEKLMSAANHLFSVGFKEIECDGQTLDIKLYPLILNDSFDSCYFKNILPSISDIVELI
jgi:hypothetical protein